MDQTEERSELDYDQDDSTEATNAFKVDWKKVPTLLDLKQDLESAEQDAQYHRMEVERWLDNLHVRGAAKPPQITGRSQVQPKVIRKQAEWRYPALSEPFLATPDLFKVKGAGENDKEGAYQHQLLLNHQFRTKLNKVQFIDNYVRTAVDEGTVIVRLGWVTEEEERTSEKPIYGFKDAVTRDEVAAFEMARLQRDLPEEWQQAMQLVQQSQRPIVPYQTATEEVTETVVTKDQPTLEVCDYKSVIPDPSCHGDLSKANFIIFTFETSQAELNKDGRYKDVEKINVDAASPLADPDTPDDEDRQNFQFKDDLRKKITAYEYWGYSDINDDGKLVPIVVTWVNGTIIRMEESPFPDGKLPFVFVPLLPKRRSLYGEPDGELLEDNQKIIGAVTRGMIDILGRSANGQRGMHQAMLDVTNKRKFERGEDYVFSGNIDPRMGYIEHTFPEIPSSAQYMLQMTQLENESLTGTKTFDNGLNAGSLGDVAAGIRGALDAASKREMSILRRLAQGMEEIGRRIASMNAEFLDKDEIVRITDREFVAVKRDALAVAYDLEVDISTAEEDNAKAQELAFMLQTLGPQADFGLVKIILRDIARLRKMPDLAARIEEYEPQPDPLAEQEKQLQIELLSAQIAKENAIAAHYANGRIPLDQAKAGEAQAKAEHLRSETDLNDLEFVQEENGVNQERELEKIGEQAKAQTKKSIVEATVKARTESQKKG